MSDVLLLYLFTRLDAMHAAMGVGAAIAGIAALFVFVTGYSDADIYQRPMNPKALRASKTLLAAALALVVGVVAIPDQKSLAIIVGGKVAIDAARSPEAKEIGGLVLDAIKRQLQEEKK